MGIIEQPGGVVALAAGADPAVERVLGWRRFWLGVDLAQAQDWTALIVVKDECLPLWHGSRQVPRRTRANDCFCRPFQRHLLSRRCVPPYCHDAARATGRQNRACD